MNKNKIFCFDIDDTLYDLEYPFKLAFYTMFNYLPPNIHEIFLDFRKYNNEIYDKALNGDISMEYLCIYRAKKSFLKHGISIDDNDALRFQMIYLEEKKHIKLDDNIILSLEFLKSNKINVGIISNGPHKEQYEKIDYLNLYNYIDKKHIFISEDIGYHKPNSKIFEFAEKNIINSIISSKHKSLLSPERNNFEFFYIGDSFENDVIGAKKSNFKSIWLNHRNYKIDCKLYIPDYEVNSFYELYSLIKKLI